MVERAWSQHVLQLVVRRQFAPDKAEAERKDDVCDTGAEQTSTRRVRRGQSQTRHVNYSRTHNKTGAENVGNSTFSAPAMSKPGSGDPRSGKSYSSAGSSPSASRSAGPARICSAIRPEFCRIAISIFAVMSGLALRNAFEFSRPCPSRWLS